MDLSDSVIIVTGASSGIGAALAPQLAEPARRSASWPAAPSGSRRPRRAGASRRVDDVVGRPRRPGCRDPRRAEAIERFGPIDAIVNNAAIGKRKLAQALTARLDTTLRINFTSPIRMAMTLLPTMIERGSGLIVNVSSMGPARHRTRAAYCASKFAMSGWSESARIDLDGTGVRVKLVLPGPIATEIWEPRPGELPGLYDGPFVTADDCGADIVRAIEDPDGFEYYVPEPVPGGWPQKDLVVGKTTDCDQFLTGMAQMAVGTS